MAQKDRELELLRVKNGKENPEANVRPLYGVFRHYLTIMSPMTMGLLCLSNRTFLYYFDNDTSDNFISSKFKNSTQSSTIKTQKTNKQ